MEKFYGNNIDYIGLPYLLEATPFNKDVRINFSKKLTPDIFFNNLFANSVRYQDDTINLETYNFNNKVNNALKSRNNVFEKVNLIHIAGYGGCGKTTFIRKLIWEEQKRNSVSEHISDFEGEKSVSKYLVSLISKELFKDYKNKFMYLNCFKMINNFDLNRFEDEIELVFNFFNELRLWVNKQTVTKKQFYKETNNILLNTFKCLDNSKKIRFLLIFDFFWTLNKRIFRNDYSPLIIVYDNIDSINDTEEEQSFLIALKEFINDCNFFFGANIDNDNNYIDKKVSDIVEKTKLICFLTTRIVTIKKYLILEPDLEKVYGWVSLVMPENYYDHKSIINKRIQYYKKMEKGTPSRTIKEMDDFLDFCNNIYKSNLFKKIYNGNYRYLIDVIYNIVVDRNNSELIIESNILSKEYPEFSYGISGINLSLLLNYFKTNEIYEEKLHLSECTLNYEISLSRMVLTIIKEKGGGCSLIELFDCLYPFFDIHDICKITYDLCEAKRTIWRRLITFSKVFPKNPQEIYNQGNLYLVDKERGIEKYSRVELCKAGEAYLDYIIPSFEFMLSRHRYNDSLSTSKNYYPLFSNSSEEEITDERGNSTLRFEKKIDWVFQDVYDCCINSICFSNKVMDKLNISRDEYIENTFYNYHSNYRDGTPKQKQSYESRLIFSHIGYIEWYRRYLLKKNSSDSIKQRRINIILIGKIEKYLDLYFNEQLCFQTYLQNEAARYLQEQIKKIKATNYLDYTTRIQTD